MLPPSRAFSIQRGQALQQGHQGLYYYQSNYHRKCLHETMRDGRTDPKVNQWGPFEANKSSETLFCLKGRRKEALS